MNEPERSLDYHHYDLIIHNGRVVDGTGLPPYFADVGIRGARIATVGNLRTATATERIDASDCFVCPGFVDLHAHSDLRALVAPTYVEKIRQGVTLEILGNCGISVAPVTRSSLPLLQDAFLKLLGVESLTEPPWDWGTYQEYLDGLVRAGPSLNIGGLVGHAALRAHVMGIAARPATRREAGEMARVLDRALAEGGIGFSSGTYLGAGAADLNEMCTLARVAAEHGKLVSYHMPSYGARIVQSAELAVDIGVSSGAAIHISHIKVRGQRNWPLLAEMLAVLRRAREGGVKVTGDLYPYTAGASAAWSIFPSWAIEGGIQAFVRRLTDRAWRRRIHDLFSGDGEPNWLNVGREVGWENAYVVGVNSPGNKVWQGKSFAALAEARTATPVDALMDLLLEEDGQVTYMVFDGNEEHIETVLREPGIMIGSDGLYGGMTHPRLFGTFPRVLARYVRERQILTWEVAIQRLSALPALTLGIPSRGFVRPGTYGDIVVVSPDRVLDTATYEDPARFPEGIETVLVNGQVVVRDGVHQQSSAGVVVSL